MYQVPQRKTRAKMPQTCPQGASTPGSITGLPPEGFWTTLDTMTTPVTQWVKSLPAMQETQETWVQSQGQEDPPEEGTGNSLRYSCLENPIDRGAWWATVQRVKKSRTRLSDHACTQPAQPLAKCPLVQGWMESMGG